MPESQALTTELASRFARPALVNIAAPAHLAAGLSSVASGEYVEDHWLATFALLALI
jgi:Protein of unknown function (DUF2891)